MDVEHLQILSFFGKATASPYIPERKLETCYVVFIGTGPVFWEKKKHDYSIFLEKLEIDLSLLKPYRIRLSTSIQLLLLQQTFRSVAPFTSLATYPIKVLLLFS